MKKIESEDITMAELRGTMVNTKKYNSGELVATLVNFPLDDDEQAEIFEKLGLADNDEYFFSDYESDVDGLTEKFDIHETIERMNEVAESIEDIEPELLAAAIELGGYKLDDIIDNIDNYRLHSDISDDEDLGEYYVEMGAIDVPEHLENYIDYESVGRDVRLNAYGAHTDYGWIERE